MRSCARSPSLLVPVLDLQRQTGSARPTGLTGPRYSDTYECGGSPGPCRCCRCCCPGWCSSGSGRWTPDLGRFFFQDCLRYHEQPAGVHPAGLGIRRRPEPVPPGLKNPAHQAQLLIKLKKPVRIFWSSPRRRSRSRLTPRRPTSWTPRLPPASFRT